MTDRQAAFLDYLTTEGGFRSPDRARHFFDSLYGDVPLAGRSVLDIGCGMGLSSLWAACSGASRVVGLEPELEGSTHGNLAKLRAMVERLDLDNVEAHGTIIQEFDAGGATFDIMVMRSSINHLEEEACVHLKRDPAARGTYIRLFEKLAGLVAPGGTLIATDVSRYNLFGLLGLTNPLAPTIEWEKHQAPSRWASLLEEVGFGDRRIAWLVPRPLRRFAPLTTNRVAAFALNSRFRLQMTRRVAGS